MRSPREAERILCRPEDELTGRQSSVRYSGATPTIQCRTRRAILTSRHVTSCHVMSRPVTSCHVGCPEGCQCHTTSAVYNLVIGTRSRSNGGRLCFTSVYFIFFYFFLFTVRSQKLLERFSPNLGIVYSGVV